MSDETESTKALFKFVFIFCPAAYVVVRLLPYLFFYVLPFGLGSLFIGWLWSVGCQAGFTEYKRIAVFFPIMVFILIATVDFPSRIPEKFKGKQRIESQMLHDAFNDMKSGIEGFINWTWLSHYRWIFGSSIVPPEKYEPFPYDREDLSWVLWLSLCLGAPAFFLYRAKKADDGRIVDITARFEERVKEEQAKASGYLNDYLREKHWAKGMLEEKEKEIAKLKAVAAFAKAPALPELAREAKEEKVAVVNAGTTEKVGNPDSAEGKGSEVPKKPKDVFDVL